MNVRAVILPVLVVGAAAAIWLATRNNESAAPAATWRIGKGADVRQGRNYDELPAESPVRLSFHGETPCWVYVVSHSKEDGTLLLFPSPDLRCDLANPLPAGSAVLPGTYDGKEQAWTNRAQVLATTTFVVIAAHEPVAELESLLPHLRRFSNSVLPDRSMQVTNPTAGVDVQGKSGEPLPLPLLQRAADRSLDETLINGPLAADPIVAGVWIGSWRVKEQRDASKPPSLPGLPSAPK